MKRRTTKALSLLLAIIMSLSLFACGNDAGGNNVGDEVMNEAVITIDENGNASWEPVEGAVKYEYCIVDGDFTSLGDQYTTETTVLLPEGRSIHMRPVFADDTFGNWIISDYYGTPSKWSDDSVVDKDPSSDPSGETSEVIDLDSYVDSHFDLRWDQVKSWKLVENIDYSTLQQTDDGVTFSATAPDGSEMRFAGTGGISVSEGAITFSAGSELTALDSIGRICAYEPVISDLGEGRVDIEFSGGYTFNGATSVESVDELFLVWGFGNTTEDFKNGSAPISAMDHQPNMVGMGAGNYIEQDDFTLSELIVYYDEATYATPIKELRLNYDFYGTYLEGEPYDVTKEVYDSAAKRYDFYLMLMPDLLNKKEPLPDFMTDMIFYLVHAVIDLPQSRYTIGDLKDANGNILDKASANVYAGSTLEVTICDTTYDLELPVLEKYSGAQTLNQLSPYSNTVSEGPVTTLVIPVRWSDLPEEANADLENLIRTKLGRVVDESGKATDYSPDPADGYSLSAYYDAVSYGDYYIESFVTDWVDAPCTFEQARDINPLDDPMTEELIDMVRDRYPDMDWSRFDRNSDGIIDSVIFVSACGEQNVGMNTYGGAAYHSRGYTSEHAGTPSRPNLKDFTAIGSGMLGSQNVVLHEYAHAFGIIDYYDVTYSGIDAVGGYDMQSGSQGDWNAYSKYAVGWIEPHVVDGLGSGESVDITLGVMSETGDAIVIPAAGSEFDGPFGEYIMVDLFADCGVNRYDAAYYGLGDTTGVRIYHVNANMERRTLTGTNGDEFVIGTVHYANDYKANGKYHIELLQNGGKNTFTNKNNTITNTAPDDFFYEGDSFHAKDYDQFLINGRMDDGSEFGYTIKVISIEGSGEDAQAVIRITRN